MKDHDLLSLVEMIDGCGTTLLDTFNNLLAFAKISNVVEQDKDGKSERPGLQTAEAAIAVMDLSKLVQDVVEFVQIAYEKTKGPTAPHDNSIYATPEEGGEQPPDSSVLVSVQIQNQPSWTSKLNFGTWKRIVANIFGRSPPSSTLHNPHSRDHVGVFRGCLSMILFIPSC